MIAEPGDPIATVALDHPVDPSNAPHPSNESERLLFRQLYETLVRVDCHGRARPGLAAAWRLDADGGFWIVTLRENARFSDGSALTAADVLASWTRNDDGLEMKPHVTRLVRAIVPLDTRTLAITLRSPLTDAPIALAHTNLAIAKPAGGSRWPLGTRFSRIAPENHAPVAHGASLITVERDNASSIRFLVDRRDPRDSLDETVDLLLTRDPAALEYAATLPQFQSVPLAWRRTYVLLSPRQTSTSAGLSAEAREALADDAVRGEARGTRNPSWWLDVPGCDVARTPDRPPVTPSLTPRIVYDARDGAARDLAERFVGLGPRRIYERAAGLSGEALALARRRGRDAAYIEAVDTRPLDPCHDLRLLTESAPWLEADTIVPLVDTRLRAIVRRGRSGAALEWDGGVFLRGAGR